MKLHVTFRLFRNLDLRQMKPFQALFAIFFIANYLINPAAFAQNANIVGAKSANAVVTTPQVRAELLAFAPDGVGVGKPLMLGLQLEHQPEWHTYWKNSGDSGQPTDFSLTLPAGVQAAEVAWPVPKKIWIGRLANYGYENKVLIPIALEVSQQYKPDLFKPDLEVRLKAAWLVCKQECIPEEGEFALKIPATSSTALHKTAFDAAAAAQPQTLASSAKAVLGKEGLEFSIPSLPQALQGKSLQLFPETPEVLHNGAKLATEKPTPQDRLWSQSWAGGVWKASFPVSEQRSASPAEMPLVLTADGKTAYRVVAQVEGGAAVWPKVAAAAQVPPELAAALKANAGASAAPVSAGGEVTSFVPALLLALLGGMILNLMPCVFPVLAIKVLGFASAPDARARRLGGWAYTAGVVLSFMALGGLMLALRAGGQALGWGFQLQSPAVVAGLALLFTLIALNLLGVFEFSSVLPSSLATAQAKNPQVDAFLSGALAVAVASPCTAPFMGASLGFALGLPAWQALAIFAALGVGMAAPYLAASLMPALANLLPRPGAWMDVFKKFMAFPMLATVAWLVWVIGQQSGIHGAGALVLGLILLAMLVWALSLSGRAKLVVTSISLVCVGLFAAVLGEHIFKVQDSAVAAPTDPAWQAWAPGKTESLLAQGQPVFIDFTAAWCVTCQYNKQTTLSNSDVRQAFAAKKVQLLRADWTRRDPAITAALQQLGRSGVPVYVLYKPGAAPVIFSEVLTVSQVRDAMSQL
jgi:thiol:disulfide interchange protein